MWSEKTVYAKSCLQCRKELITQNGNHHYCQSCSDRIWKAIEDGVYCGPFKGCETYLISQLSKKSQNYAKM